MKCKHIHKDEPENTICEDCYSKGYVPEEDCHCFCCGTHSSQMNLTSIGNKPEENSDHTVVSPSSGFNLNKMKYQLKDFGVDGNTWRYNEKDVQKFIKIIQEDMKGLNGEKALKLIIKRRAGDNLI